MKRENGQDPRYGERGRNMHYEQPQGDMENSRAYYGDSTQPSRPNRRPANYGRGGSGGGDYQNGDFDRNESRYGEPNRRSAQKDSYGEEVTRSDWERTAGSGEWASGYNRADPWRDQAQGQWGDEMGNDSPYQKYEPEFGRQTSSGGFSGQGSAGSYRAQPYQARSYEGKSNQGKGPKGYERSDERIREIVCEALMDDYLIDASDISVEVKNREVKLTGTVQDRRTKYAVEELIESKARNCEIVNELRIKSAEQQGSQSGTDYGSSQSASRGASLSNQGQMGKQGQSGQSSSGKDASKGSA